MNMADLKYNVSELFNEAFGVNTPVFRTEGSAKESPQLDFSGLEMLPERDFKNGYMGTPILFPVTLEGGQYWQYKANGELEQERLEDFQLPPATMLSFRRAKNITRTNLLGSNGTVKEIYGFDDWIIDVRGLCLDEPGNPSTAQMENLLKWEKLADAIGVQGELFNQLAIDAVCIADFKRDSVQAKPWVIPFSFQLYADEAAELILPS